MEKSDIEKLAELCRLSLTDEEKTALAGDISTILSYVSDIQDMPPSADETAAVVAEPVLRDDGEPHETGKWTKTLTEAFSERDGDYAKVKQILSHE